MRQIGAHESPSIEYKVTALPCTVTIFLTWSVPCHHRVTLAAEAVDGFSFIHSRRLDLGKNHHAVGSVASKNRSKARPDENRRRWRRGRVHGRTRRRGRLPKKSRRRAQVAFFSQHAATPSKKSARMDGVSFITHRQKHRVSDWLHARAWV